ncbi:MAG: hypothetical protein IT383_26785 [Deltaproteobacteria bacterium]|nr:hypothetical protein [Deltaproteobacteria bacterium]
MKGRLSSVAMVVTLGAAACPQVPAEDTLTLSGDLERDGVGGSSSTAVSVDFGSKNARGEWWSCDLRLTANACVGQHHVNLYVALPSVVDFDGLGHAACVGSDGQPWGAFELLTQKTNDGEPITVPGDATVLVLVASDVDGDGAADLADDAETTASTRVMDGEVTVLHIGSFDDPLSIRVEGTTANGNAVSAEFSGPTSPAPNPPPLDVARTCVDADAL